jgi:hypothetical protein
MIDRSLIEENVRSVGEREEGGAERESQKRNQSHRLARNPTAPSAP